MKQILRKPLPPAAISAALVLTSFLPTTIFSAAIFSAGIAAAPPAIAADTAAEAFKLYQAKQYKEAAQMFDNCMNASKPDPTVCYYAAVCNQEAGNIGRARSLYQQVVQLSPGSTIAGYSENILKKLDPSAGMTTAAASFNPYKRNSQQQLPVEVTGPDEARVYFRWSGQAMMIPVEINNRTVEMVMDTGAPGVFIGKNQLRTIGAPGPNGPPVGQTGGAANATKQNFYLMNATVKVGPFVMNNAMLKVVELNQAPPLLGQDFLKNFDYTIDRGARCVHFVRKGSNNAVAKTGYSIPFEFREGGNRIVVEAEINGKKAKVMMDTGNAASGLTFGSVDQAKDYGLAPPSDAKVVTHGGVSGTGKAYAYYANRVRLGPIDRSNITVLTNTTGNEMELPLLGHQFFANWQYNVDLKERKIWFLRR